MQSQGNVRATVLPLVLFGVCLVGLVVNRSVLESRWRLNAEREVDLTATEASLRLQGFIRDRLLAVQALSDSVVPGEADWQQDFSDRSNILQSNFGGFQALNWVNAEGTIVIVAPEEPNARALGQQVRNNEAAGRAFLAAQSSVSPRMTAPIGLFQGGRGVATYVPVVRDGVTVGYLNAVFRIDALVSAALADGVLDSYDIRLDDGDSLVFSSASFTVAAKAPTSASELMVADRKWTLLAQPGKSRWAEMQSTRSRWDLLLGALFAGLASWLLRRSMLRASRHAQLQLQLERTSKMEALGRLAGGIAHDFNNLLAAVVGNAELIRLGTRDSELQATAQEIVSISARAAALTRQLLTFSSVDDGEVETFDVNAEIDGLQDMLRRLIRESIDMEIELGVMVPNLRCSRAQVCQILVNLVANASDAMPKGGTLRIITGQQEAPEGRSGLLLSVSDTGEGMDMATQGRVFEPFFSTKGSNRNGVGLGLATVYGIVDGLGGTIHMDSQPGQGCCIRIWIPGATDEATPMPSLPVSDTAIFETRVLLVEDDPSVRAATERVLKRRGFDVVVAANGRIALDLLLECGADRFDVMISDSIMPEMSGMELIHEMRARGMTLPVLICSGYSEELAKPSTLEDMGVGFLAKPYAFPDLLRAIEVAVAAAPSPGSELAI